jgi:hypothetical protein
VYAGCDTVLIAKKNRAACVARIRHGSEKNQFAGGTVSSHGIYMCPGADLLPPDTIRGCLKCMPQDISEKI